MNDLSGLLQQALANPQLMGQLASMAQSLGLQPPQSAPQDPPNCSPGPAVCPSGDLGAMMGTVMQMARGAGGDESQMALIQALRPFLRPDRVAKLERTLQIARVSRLAGGALRNPGGSFGQAGDGHV